MPQITRAPAVTADLARLPLSSAIDTWQPVRRLGDGQWTTVYQARPKGSPDDWPADYVIKVVKPEHENDEIAINQIYHESQVGKQVTHPHLISILSGRVDRPPFYVVMPYLEGMTLSALLLKSQSICLPQALWIVRQAADALSSLHLERWMHADVKPSNIHISPQGHVTLIDLGFARPFESLAEESNELVGTLNYAAPEVFIPSRGRDGQSDIYSLGVILFELLTRRLPFVDEDACNLALAHLREEPPDPRTLAPTLPPRVARLLRRMLAKEPLRRPLASDLVNTLMDLEIESFDDWQLEPRVSEMSGTG